MKLILPSNIFTKIISSNLDPDLKENLVYKPSSLISAEIKKDENSIGLIPTLDLLNNYELFVSKEFGLSFESSLCNSYIYFKPGQEDVNELSLLGDVSSMEAILSKILFREVYNTDVKLEILTSEKDLNNKNLIIAGNKNFENERFLSGISFSEEVIESLSLPFVNYVFASTGKENLEELNSKLKNLSGLVYDNIEDYKFGENLSEMTKEYVKTNISSLVIDFASNDIEGITQLLRLPYYHGIIKDIIEVNFM
jgi:hypothetical protein